MFCLIGNSLHFHSRLFLRSWTIFYRNLQRFENFLKKIFTLLNFGLVFLNVILNLHVKVSHQASRFINFLIICISKIIIILIKHGALKHITSLLPSSTACYVLGLESVPNMYLYKFDDHFLHTTTSANCSRIKALFKKVDK